MDVEPVAVERASVAWIHARREVTWGFALAGAGALGAVELTRWPHGRICDECILPWLGLGLATVTTTAVGDVLVIAGAAQGAHANDLAGIRTSAAPLALAVPVFVVGSVASIELSRSGSRAAPIVAVATGAAVVGLGALQWNLDVHDAYAADVHVVLTPSGGSVFVRW